MATREPSLQHAHINCIDNVLPTLVEYVFLDMLRYKVRGKNKKQERSKAENLKHIDSAVFPNK